jgi:hypothetical protein
MTPDPEWITRVQAAEILDCSPPTVGKLADEGRLVRRKMPTAFPSILASSARALAVEREAERSAREATRAERAQRWTPPPNGDVWLDAKTAAAVLGLTRARMYQRAHAGRTPFTWHGGKMWFRRSDIEIRAAVMAFQRRRSHARTP